MACEFTPTPDLARVLRFLQLSRAVASPAGNRLQAGRVQLLEPVQALLPFADGQIPFDGFNARTGGSCERSRAKTWENSLAQMVCNWYICISTNP